MILKGKIFSSCYEASGLKLHIKNSIEFFFSFNNVDSLDLLDRALDDR